MRVREGGRDREAETETDTETERQRLRLRQKQKRGEGGGHTARECMMGVLTMRRTRDPTMLLRLSDTNAFVLLAGASDCACAGAGGIRVSPKQDTHLPRQQQNA